MEGTILLVDDEETNLKLLEKMLLPEGYKVLKANSGKTALETLKTEKVQMILLDVIMPEMNGFDVLKTVREDKVLCVLPVILLTSLGSKENRLNGLQLGADDYITKPFDIEELRAKINTLLKLDYLKKQLNENAKLAKVIDKIDEGIVISDKKFAPYIVNLKAREMLGIKELPGNILTYVNEKYSDEIVAGLIRKNYILKQNIYDKNNDRHISLTMEAIKGANDEIDSYILVFKMV